MAVEKTIGSNSLVEVVDRILDKGIVVAGDIHGHRANLLRVIAWADLPFSYPEAAAC